MLLEHQISMLDKLLKDHVTKGTKKGTLSDLDIFSLNYSYVHTHPDTDT